MSKISRYKLNYYIKVSVIVTIFSTLFFIISLITIATTDPFKYWYLLILPIFGQIILGIIYINFTRKIDSPTKAPIVKIQNKLLLIIFLDLLCMNIFVFIFGIVMYNKIYSRHNSFY